jgi:hypothetical protein
MMAQRSLIGPCALPLTYLLFAGYTIMDAALGGPAPDRWYDATMVTLPLSAVFYRQQSLPAFIGFALFTALLLFLVSWGITSVFRAMFGRQA